MTKKPTKKKAVRKPAKKATRKVAVKREAPAKPERRARRDWNWQWRKNV